MLYSDQTVSVHLPRSLFQRLQRIAAVTHRSVEDVLTTTVDVALPAIPDIPVDIADELAAMVLFSDESLKAAAQPSLSAAQQERLAQLSHAGGERPLSKIEERELKHLLELHDRAVLRRARALAILAQRGYDVDIVGQWSVPANVE